jgi:hypothetical protein
LAWQLHVLGNNGSGYAPLELIVRGDNRAQGDFFGTAVSAATSPLTNATGNWIHLAGGYDAASGQLRLFVDGVAYISGNNSVGAHNSGGYPLSIGTGKNGTNFQFFAASAFVDDVQLYSGPLAHYIVQLRRRHRCRFARIRLHQRHQLHRSGVHRPLWVHRRIQSHRRRFIHLRHPQQGAPGLGPRRNPTLQAVCARAEALNPG